MKSVVFAVVCSVMVAVPWVAKADEPLNGSGPETCTLEAFQKESRECVVCRAYYRNRTHCERALSEYQFSKSCRTRDVSAWREVWCRKPDASSKKLPADLLASLDDATAGEKETRERRHWGVPGGTSDDDAGAESNDGGASAAGEAGSANDKTEPLVVRKPEGGCACSLNESGTSGPIGWSVAAIACAAVIGRRATRYRKDRSGR